MRAHERSGGVPLLDIVSYFCILSFGGLFVQYKIERFGDRYKLTVYFTERGAVISSNLDKQSNDCKLDNNISRAKARVLELALCNPWQYFCTLTINGDKQDRYSLSSYIKDLGNWIGNYNRKFDTKLKYLLVPEQHKDGAYHAHALLCGVSPDSLIKNQYGYADMPYYKNRFGFISLDPIRDLDKTASYVTKYVTKTFATSREIGEHLFYSSQGLNGKEVIHDGITQPIECSFFNEYVGVEWDTDVQRLFGKIHGI